MSTTVKAPRLKQIYIDKVIPDLRERYGHGNPMQANDMELPVLPVDTHI